MGDEETLSRQIKKKEEEVAGALDEVKTEAGRIIEEARRETEAALAGLPSGRAGDAGKTLLQQIRDKEQEVAGALEKVKTEAGSLIADAHREADVILNGARTEGAVAAENVFRTVRAETESAIKTLKEQAAHETEVLITRGQKNLAAATEEIVRHVTGKSS